MSDEQAQMLDNFMRGPVPPEVHGAYLALADERDQLRARIDAYEGAVEAWEEIRQAIEQSSLGTPGAVAVRESTPESVGRAIVLGAKYLRERDEALADLHREREVKRINDQAFRGVVADRDDWRNIADDVNAELADTKAERDRLRAVNTREQKSADSARAARERAWQYIRELEAERDRLRAELDTANAELEDAHRFERDARQVEAERDRLRAVVDAAHDLVMAFDTQPDYGEEMDALRAALLAQLDVSPTIGGMTPEEAYEFYADPTNQEPQGPPVRRPGRSPITGGDADD